MVVTGISLRTIRIHLRMPRRPLGRTKVNIYLDDKVMQALRLIGEARGTTYSELIREAMRVYVLKEGPKFLQEQRALQELST